MVHQQNIGRHAIAVVALRAPSNRLADTRPLMPALLALRCYASMIFRKASVENTRGVTRGEATSSYWSPTLQKCFRMVKQ